MGGWCEWRWWSSVRPGDELGDGVVLLGLGGVVVHHAGSEVADGLCELFELLSGGVDGLVGLSEFGGGRSVQAGSFRRAQKVLMSMVGGWSTCSGLSTGGAGGGWSTVNARNARCA